ncbi:MAG: DUF4384 domain-containing protein [bacterium]|nr:DUF4384 domain-containing protein [bacterium]
MHRRASARSALAAGLAYFLLVAGTLVPGPGAAAATPDWVEQNGTAAAFPAGRFLVGFAQTTGKNEDAVEAAKQQAAADLARQVSVQIESNVVDVLHEQKGHIENELTSRIRATSDIRLDGVRFETHRKRKRVYALAILERLPAAGARRRQRDRAMAETEGCLEAAAAEEAAGRAQQALDAYRGCRRSLDEALEHEAVAAALSRGGLLGDDVGATLAAQSTRISARIRALPHEDATSIRGATSALAAQLAEAGIGRGATLVVAPLLYQGRDVSSPFGREVALSLESAIGRSEVGSAPASGTVVLRGTYAELQADPSVEVVADVGDTTGPAHAASKRDAPARDFQLRVNAKEAATGRLLASAEVVLAGSGVPATLATRPANFERFAEDADKLAGGDVVSGDLRVEVRTDRGDRGIVYDEGEELSLYVRVNQPAWVRLIYVLTSGDHVPITQEWYIDQDKVNQLVEYPSSFEIVPPFGVEMIHAMASNERPPKLVTRTTTIDGERYTVIPDGADQVVRTRGIARRARKQVAEQTLTLTTMRRPR